MSKKSITMNAPAAESDTRNNSKGDSKGKKTNKRGRPRKTRPRKYNKGWITGPDFYVESNLKLRDVTVEFPDKKKTNKKHLWCPYCGDYKHFKKYWHVKRCIGCGISNSDYYVRKANSMFN